MRHVPVQGFVSPGLVEALGAGVPSELAGADEDEGDALLAAPGTCG